jgi:hypothetical protein
VPVPFASIQIILMELFMDLAAATFVAEPPKVGLMQGPPRNPRAPFMDRAIDSSVAICLQLNAYGRILVTHQRFNTLWRDIL